MNVEYLPREVQRGMKGLSAAAPQRAVGGRSQLPLHADQLQSEQVGGGRQLGAPDPHLGRPAGAERERRRRHLGQYERIVNMRTGVFR